MTPPPEDYSKVARQYRRDTNRMRHQRRRLRQGRRPTPAEVARSVLVVGLQLSVVLAAVAIACGAWIFIHALDATGRLADARTDIARLRADLLAGRPADADMIAAQKDAAAARKDTHDFVWDAASWLPPVKTIRGITDAIDTLGKGALPPFVKVGASLSPGALRIKPDTIDLMPLVKAASTMRRAAAAATLARTQVADTPNGWIGLISTARGKVLDELSSLAGQVDNVARFTTAGPDMLGLHGTRRYFVGIQNNAESRATGGLVASYAVVTARHGRIHVAEHGSDAVLQPFQPSTPVVKYSKEYANEYGNYHPAQSWLTSNVSPNFPDAGNIWTHLWEAESGQRIDGAFGVDPVGLAEILGAVGTVTLKGYPGVYSGANLDSFIESDEYVQFAGINNTLRKNFLSEVGTAVIKKMLSGSGNPVAITSALGQAAGEGHLELWAQKPVEEAQIAGTPLAGILSPTTGPFASVTVNNATASKLDYYLSRSLTYSAGSCSGSQRASSITVALTNDAPLHGLPAYVRITTLRDGEPHVEEVPNNHLFVFIHATAGASLLRATLDGNPVPVGSGLEQGHPVYLVDLHIAPRETRTIVLDLNEPTSARGSATTKVQPLARAQQTNFEVPRCD